MVLARSISLAVSLTAACPPKSQHRRVILPALREAEGPHVFLDGVTCPVAVGRDLLVSFCFTSAGCWRDDSTRIVILRRKPLAAERTSLAVGF